MNNAFSRLRARPQGQQASVLAGLIGLAGANAEAATVNLPQDIITGGVTYSNISNSTFFPSSVGLGNGSGYGIDDATTAAHSDAFDGFGGIVVNGNTFQQPGGQVDSTTTADGTFLTTETPQSIGGIDVSQDFFFDASSPTIRALATLTNTTGSSQAITLAYGGNLGSDSQTKIEATSSGDAVFDQAIDEWLISSDNLDGQGIGDPVLTFARFDTGALVPSSTAAFPQDGVTTDNFYDIWTFNLDAGETANLLWFVNLNPTVSDALSNTGTFDNLDTLNAAGLLAGLSSAQIDQSLNWNPQAPSAAPIPSTLPLLALALVGAMVSRRLRR